MAEVRWDEAIWGLDIEEGELVEGSVITNIRSVQLR